MKVSISHLGVLNHAEFSLGDLTLLCGDNNTGKTYATYALFGFLANWRHHLSVDIPDQTVDSLLNDGLVRIDIARIAEQSTDIIRSGCDAYVKSLSDVFASNQDRFENTEFHISPDDGTLTIVPKRPLLRKLGTAEATLMSLSKEQDDPHLTIAFQTSELQTWSRDLVKLVVSSEILDLLFDRLFPRPFIASAERTGATMFRSELDAGRPQKTLFDSRDPDYPLPVEQNIDFIRRIERITKRTSFIAKDHQHILKEFSDIIGGEYLVDENDPIYFRPAHRLLSLTMDESSSAVRALLVIGLYLRHVARPGDLLMIDEPELNLHPRNQRRIARLFARLMNIGIRVFATTHSDYVVKELNTLIMLNQDSPHRRRIAEAEGYQREELLDPNRVNVYVAERSQPRAEGSPRGYTLLPASIDPGIGIEVRSFDETINKMNEIQEAILWESW